MQIRVDQAMRRANALAKKGEGSEAAKIYRSILQTYPNNKRAQQGLAKLTVSPVDQFVARAAYERLALLFRDEEFDEVVREGEKLAVSHPDDFLLQFMLGAAKTALGRPEDAEPHYRWGLELKPDYAGGHYSLGMIHLGKENFDKAIACFEAAARLNPGSADTHYNLGLAFKRMGAPEKAGRSYEAALGVDPKHVNAQYGIGTVLQDLEDLDAAETRYRKVIMLKPDHAEAHNALGLVLHRKGALEDAVAFYQRSLELAPDVAEVYNNLGAALSEAGNAEAAAASFRKAIDLKPDYAEAHNSLGIYQQDFGVPADAVASFDRALAADPDYTIARAHKLFQLAKLCDWEALRAEADYIADLGIEGRGVAPFVMAVLDDDRSATGSGPRTIARRSSGTSTRRR